MPSSHSAVISYYASFISLAATRLAVHPSLRSVPPQLITVLGPIGIVTTAVVVCVSRIRLGHHTVKQVGAGILVGTVGGVAWFWWWSRGQAQDIAWDIVDHLPNFIKTYIR